MWSLRQRATVAMYVACAACRGSVEGGSLDSGLLSVEGGGAAAPGQTGSGASCPSTSQQVVAIEVRASVTWPSTGKYAGGSGTYVIWLRSQYSIDAQHRIAASMRICQIVLPPVPLQFCGLATSIPQGLTQYLRLSSPASEWKKVTKTISAAGAVGGQTVGASIRIDPAVFLYGLKDSSPYAASATPWPGPSADPFGDPPDYVDEQGDGTPGITLLLADNDPNYPGLPEIPLNLGGVGCGGTGRAADRIFQVSRLEMSLAGVRTSCTEARGVADVPLIDGRIVGCDVESDAGACTPNEVDFVDSNLPAWQPTGSASFEQVVLPAGGAATCDDVVAALPEADD
jgi:hypothetical protein